MSASREKKTRLDEAVTSTNDPKTAQEAKQRKEQKRSNILYGTIAVAFVVVAAACLIWKSNIIPRNTTAATIDGEKYNSAEVNFYYQNAYLNFLNQNYYFLSYLGLDTNTSMKNQTINESAASMLGAEEGQTWYDFFLNLALKQMSTVQTALKNAEAEGFVYPAGVQAQYDDTMTNLKTTAAASGVSTSQYLKSKFGSGMTQKIYEEQLMRMLQYTAYTTAYENGLTFSDEELETAYAANTNAYDRVSYESVTISGAAESTQDADGNTVEPTEEESAAALSAAKEAADKMLADYKAGSKLDTLADGNDKATYTENENGTYSGDVLTEWLFDSARKTGDAAVLESGSSYYVAVFRGRTREEYNTIDVRHILIRPATGEKAEGDEGYEDEQAQLKADAKAKAEDILAQWQSGEATEDSFAALAMVNSADGSKYDGGLYTQVYQGQMVDTFNDWCFDSSRKAGDTGVVETTYGYHVMYFVGTDLPYWQSLVAADLKTEAYNTWIDGLAADAVIEQSASGMKYVG